MKKELQVGSIPRILQLLGVAPPARKVSRGDARWPSDWIVFGDDSAYRAEIDAARAAVGWMQRDDALCRVQSKHASEYFFPDLGTSIYGYTTICRSTENMGGGGRFTQRGATLEEAIAAGLQVVAERPGSTFSVPVDDAYTPIPEEVMNAMRERVQL